MEICLIRHTTPLIKKGICYGQSDLDLADTYPEELVDVKRKVHGTFDKVYSSPLKRCKTLAQDLFPNEKINFEESIKEVNFGDWEMVPWDKMDKTYQKKWMDNFVEIAPPNGESLNQLNDRVEGFLSSISKENSQRIALVTHSGVIRNIMAIIDRTPLSKCFDFHLSYGAVKTVFKN